MPKNAESSVHKNTAMVITGGSSGIGKSIIEQYIKVGSERVVCNLSRSKPELSSGAKGLYHFPCDLTNSESLQHSLTEVIKTLEKVQPTGRVILVNNSGVGAYGPFDKSSLDEEINVIDLNIRAVVMLTQGLLPLLLERGGTVVNIASTASFQPTPNLITYGASKSFLMHWSLGLSEDLKKQGVHVLCVCPGPTRTNFFRNAGFKESPLPDSMGQSADAVTETTFRALEKGKILVVSGWDNVLMSFFSSKLPKVWVTRLAGFILRRVR